MAIEKIKNFADYDNYPADSNPTTNANMQDYMSNQNNVLKALTNVLLWQPQTNYIAGQEVHSPDMPVGYVALCSVAGQSGLTQPNWNSTSKTYTDGGVTWEITKRINVYQGVENADKVLMVGKNGEVSPQDSGAIAAIVDLANDVVNLSRNKVNKHNPSDNIYSEINGGTNYLDGATLLLGGKNCTDNNLNGGFTLQTSNGNAMDIHVLRGKTDGTLSWNGDSVIIGRTLKEWTDDSWLDVCGGTAWNQGACINLSGKNSERNGSFFIMARANDDTVSTLNGDANGVLQWNNKTVLNRDDFTTASLEARVSNGDFVYAPAVNGFKFLCWLQPASVGWVGSPYVLNPNQDTTIVYGVGGGNNVRFTALYVRY